MDSGFTARWAGLPAIAVRRPGSLARLHERLPRALTHHRAPQAASTRLFELAGLILLTSFGLAIDAVAAWVLLALPLTAIMVLLVADLEASRARSVRAARGARGRAPGPAAG